MVLLGDIIGRPATITLGRCKQRELDKMKVNSIEGIRVIAVAMGRNERGGGIGSVRFDGKQRLPKLSDEGGAVLQP